jgi:hypothetical protein
MPNDTMTERITGAAIKVHTAIRAGCLESTYHACLAYQFEVDGLVFEHQVRLPITQVVTYLKLSGHRVGLLINFNVPHLRQGIRRVVNNYPEKA